MADANDLSTGYMVRSDSNALSEAQRRLSEFNAAAATRSGAAPKAPAAKPSTPAPGGSGGAYGVVSDIALGTITSPVHAGGGVLDAIGGGFHALSSVGDWLDTTLGTSIELPSSGNKAVDAIVSSLGRPLDTLSKVGDLVPESGTVTGGVVREGAKFIAGFIPALRAMRAVGVTNKVGQVAGASAAVGAVVADPNQPVPGHGDERERPADLRDRFNERSLRVVGAGARKQVNDDFGVGGRLKDRTGMHECVAQFARVDQIAVVSDGQVAVHAVHDQRLSIGQTAVTSRRIPHVPDRRLARQLRNLVVVEGVVDELSTKEESPELINRARNAVVDAGFGVAAEGVFKGVLAIARARRGASAVPKTPEEAVRAEYGEVTPEQLAPLGNDTAPVFTTSKATADKIAKGAKETEGLTSIPSPDGQSNFFINFARRRSGSAN